MAPTMRAAEVASKDEHPRADGAKQTANADRRVQIAVPRFARLQDVDRQDHGERLQAAVEEAIEGLDDPDPDQRKHRQRCV